MDHIYQGGQRPTGLRGSVGQSATIKYKTKVCPSFAEDSLEMAGPPWLVPVGRRGLGVAGGGGSGWGGKAWAASLGGVW